MGILEILLGFNIVEIFSTIFWMTLNSTKLPLKWIYPENIGHQTCPVSYLDVKGISFPLLNVITHYDNHLFHHAFPSPQVLIIT